MEQSFMHADVFFFIASIGFSIMGVLAIVLLAYLISIARSARRLVKKAEANIERITDEAKEFVEDIRDNRFFQLFARPKKRTKRSVTE